MSESLNPIELAVFVARCAAVCGEMGLILRSAAFSPNIKDRLDYSCALFDADGRMFAQAAHVPVHLGSMAFAMQQVVGLRQWQAGDELIWNDPFLGGTHLPDVTLVRPFFSGSCLLGFVANRAHHAQIGAATPGSMPLSKHLDEEGLVIPPTLLFEGGEVNTALRASLQTALGAGTAADLAAQSSANRVGIDRLEQMITALSAERLVHAIEQLNGYGRAVAEAGVRRIPDGRYSFTDVMDSDGHAAANCAIKVAITVVDAAVQVDFTGTSAAVPGNINCPLSVTAAGVFYVIRCLLPAETPACAGAFDVVTLQATPGCLVHAQRPAATAAGNVETSMRIVDCMLGALAEALPNEIPAASQGTMNNVAMGQVGHWDYYETLGGGTGASSNQAGIDAVQSHMTNTLNTPIEVLESNYPIEVLEYSVRAGSGGAGKQAGGCGLVRSYRFLAETEVTLITERRVSAPWGLAGGDPGLSGMNYLDGQSLPDKVQLSVLPNQVLRIETPGGGGWGDKD